MKLLVVEDEALNREGMKLLLRDDEIQAVATGRQAFEILAVWQPDGAITDLVGTGGTAVVKQIRAQYPAMPVVILTGLEDVPSMAGDPMVRVLIKGHNGPLEARQALAEMMR